MKLLLRIRYKGTAYAGYQVQNNAPTVQGALNAATAALFGYDCDITGCSRTDAGVHALCFCATVQKRGEDYLETDIPIEKIPLALNFRLPEDIAVCGAAFVPNEFHARYSVISKTYEYHIVDSPYRHPLLSDTAYHYHRSLTDAQIADMNIAAKNICGEHDFSSFMAAGSKITDPVRNVYSCTVTRTGEEIIIRISADGFLYNMVRIICGTLLDVAKGLYTPQEILEVIESKNRSAAGPTLPAHGLYLSEVNYSNDYFA